MAEKAAEEFVQIR